MRHRTGLVALLAVSAFAAAGCAIPTQNAPNAIAPSKVPFGLLNRHPPTTTTTQPKPSSFVPVRVYFLNSTNQLEPTARVVATPAPLSSIITAMLAGPTSAEAAAGIFTAIPSDVTVLSTTTQGSVVTVNLNTAFGQITGNDTELSVAQIVATIATENGLTTGVIFEIDGQRTSVPIANGSQVTGPVYLNQFLNVAPAP